MDQEKLNISHALLMAYLLNEADDKQSAEVDTWLSASEDNAKYLKSLELLWIESGKLSPPPVDVNFSEAWKKVSGKLNFNSEVRSIQKSEKSFSLKPIWQVAAMIIVIFGAYGVFKLMTNVKHETLTAENKIITDTLHDGSIIKLNKNSSLTFPGKFEKHSRNVHLKGEAFFEVEHIEEQPFQIEVAGAFVKVLGTSFNVKEVTEENLVEVYVHSGIVELFMLNDERDTSSVILKKGEKGIVNTSSGIAQKPNDLGMNANEISWMNDTFVFDGVRLEYVAEFLESYYAIEMVLQKDTIKDMMLTANFKNDNIDEIIEIIADSFGLKIKKEKFTYYLDEVED